MRRVSRKSLALGLIAGAALSLAAAAADTPSGSGVSFVNGSNHHITFYARYGSDGSCENQPKAQTVSIESNQTVSVDSGSSKVCFCLQVPERGSCSTGWAEVKAGGTRHLR